MPRLRRLSGQEIIDILAQFGFVVIRIRGRHYRLKREIGGQSQYLTVPVHGSKPLAAGTIRSVYRQACTYIDRDILEPHFFAP